MLACFACKLAVSAYNVVSLNQNSFAMNNSYKDLLKQRELLEQQINEARHREISDALAKIQSIIVEFSLTQQDVFPVGRSRSAAKGSKVAAKYRDPATGATWTGRGKAPRWIQDKDRAQFEIK